MWWMLAAPSLAGDEVMDPGCKGRVSARDSELEFALIFEEEGKAPQTVTISQGSGPDESRASVQTRLRGRMDALSACYAPLVGVRGPTVGVLVSFDVANGRPTNVTVESAFGELALRKCVREVVQQTPMLCKLDAPNFVFPIKFEANP